MPSEMPQADRRRGPARNHSVNWGEFHTVGYWVQLLYVGNSPAEQIKVDNPVV